MRKLIVLMMLCWSLWANAITPQEIADELQKTPQIYGEFTQLRHLRGMDTPLESHGRFALVAGEGLWWGLEKAVCGFA